MKMKLFASLLSALFLLAAPAAAHSPPQEQGLQFVDTTGDFDRVWNETKDLPDGERVAAFKMKFARVLPGFYDEKRVADFIAPGHYDQMILKGLKAYPERRDGIRRVSRQFAALVAPARHEFETYFGKMLVYPPIYLVVCFGEFDGGTRDLADGTHLMFGADVIDQIYKADTPIKPLVEHELFHLMHGRTFADCDPLWCSLWKEGLATYVASTFNPGASDAALGLTIPQPIRPAVEARRNEAICAVRARLTSTRPDDYASLFYGNRKVPDFPARMGYYVGLLVVTEAGKTRSPRELAALSPEQVQPLVERTLAGMADCTRGERG
jgi:hypothetical protein